MIRPLNRFFTAPPSRWSTAPFLGNSRGSLTVVYLARWKRFSRHQRIKRHGLRSPPRAISKRPAARYHLPITTPRLHKTVGSCDRWIAKNVGVKSRIHPVQAARFHKPAPIASMVIERRPGRTSAEQAQDAGDCNRDESPFSVHFNLRCFSTHE
jgi:hypothetical protein